MKKLTYILSFTLVLYSCQKEVITPTKVIPQNGKTKLNATAQVLATIENENRSGSRTDKPRCAWKLKDGPSSDPVNCPIPMDCTVPRGRVCKCGSSCSIKFPDVKDFFPDLRDEKQFFELSQEEINENEKFVFYLSEHLDEVPEIDKKRCGWKLKDGPSTDPVNCPIPMDCTVPKSRVCNCGESCSVVTNEVLQKYFPKVSDLKEFMLLPVEVINENIEFVEYLNKNVD